MKHLCRQGSTKGNENIYSTLDTRRLTLFLVFLGIMLFPSIHSYARMPVVSAGEVKSWLDEKRKFVLIDTRLPEEYEQAHIPGAINIPAERMTLERSKLPKDKSTLLVFYCRGTG